MKTKKKALIRLKDFIIPSIVLISSAVYVFHARQAEVKQIVKERFVEVSEASGLAMQFNKDINNK